jgi:pantetheine-phosphate adenylyltransferase
MTSPLSQRVAVYPGTFDPLHLGHLDIIGRGSRIFDRIIVGVGINTDKKPIFDLDERVDLVRRVTRSLPNVSAQPFTGLAVAFARDVGARVMMRGLRTTSDMENEFAMSLMNLNLDPEIETVFLMAKEPYSHVRGSLLREIATLGGALDKFLPPEVKQALEARIRKSKGI